MTLNGVKSIAVKTKNFVIEAIETVQDAVIELGSKIKDVSIAVVDGTKYFIVSSIRSASSAIQNFAVAATSATCKLLKSAALAAKSFFKEAPGKIKEAFCFIFNCNTFRKLG